jgi:hypothetical protein
VLALNWLFGEQFMPLANAILMAVSTGFALSILAWSGAFACKIVAAGLAFAGQLGDKMGKSLHGER